VKAIFTRWKFAEINPQTFNIDLVMVVNLIQQLAMMQTPLYRYDGSVGDFKFQK
jgi:hypothetical protein